MSKRFRNKHCAYCGLAGETADHVFARAFFPVEDRADLPQVSACTPCNRAKSELEHYVLSVLPFGGQHSASIRLLREDVPRRLSRNQKLHRTLSEGRRPILVRDSEGVRESLSIPLDVQKLSDLFSYIARGLAHFTWGITVPRDYFVGVGFLTAHGERLFEQLMVSQSQAEVQGDLGKGLILYQGVQARGDALSTLWRFRLYGGVHFGGDPVAPGEVPSTLWASTGPMPIGGAFVPDRASALHDK